MKLFIKGQESFDSEIDIPTCSICSCAHSGLAKFMYAFVLLVTVVIACIMLAPGVETWLNKLPFCEPTDHSQNGFSPDSSLQKAMDYGK